MKLSYFQLLSPEPFSIGVGHIIPPKLGKIWDYGDKNYESLLFYSVLNVSKFYKYFIPDRYQEYCNASDEDKQDITLFHLVCSYQEIAYEYVRLFNFFFVEYVNYNPEQKRFNLFTKQAKDGQEQMSLCGVINETNFIDVLSIIAQLCSVEPVKSAQDDIDQIKDKAILNMLRKIENARKKRGGDKVTQKKTDPQYELGNIVSVVSSYGSNNIDHTNLRW